MYQIADYIQSSRNFHRNTYKSLGREAQRNFPSEDVIRFACTYLDKNVRHRILDVGCAFGVNTAALASISKKWDIKGVDFCIEAVDVASNALLDNLHFEVDILPYLPLQENNSRDAIVDHMCSYGLIRADFTRCMSRYRQILKTNGFLYLKTLSDKSDMIRDYPSETLVEERTLSCIKRKNAPFPKDDYLFRFTNKDELIQIACACGFTCKSIELRARTYRQMQEYYEQIDAVFVAI